jgi:spermidine synthase
MLARDPGSSGAPRPGRAPLPALLERWLPALLFLGSGASSLTYEVVWQKRLFVALGASAPATTVVLAAFCIGLGLGGQVGAVLARRMPRPWLLYGLIELCIGAGALAFPALLGVMDALYPALVPATGALETGAVVWRLVLALGCLLPATIAMGATVPVMSVLLSRTRRAEAAGEVVSLAYTLNTLGAVAGCWAAGLHLVPTLGQTATLRLALAINVTCGLAALAFSSRTAATADPDDAEVIAAAASSPASAGMAPGALRAIALSYAALGGLAFAFEVLAFRILAIDCTGGNVTFAVGLAVYLAGLAAGSGPLYRTAVRLAGERRSLLVAAAGTAAALLVQLPALSRLPALRDAARALGTSAGLSPLGALAFSETLTSAGVLLVPALFLGMSFPAACALLIAGRPQLRRSGQVYLIGNVGALAGVLLTALWLVPAAGLVGGYAVITAMVVLVAAALVMVLGIAPRLGLPVVAVALLWAIAYGSTGTPFFRTGQARRAGDGWELTGLGGENSAPPVDVLRYRAGTSATVMVKREPYATMSGRAAQVGLYVDDQLVASTHPSARVDSKLLAHLPLLLHPAPRRALTVGFGSGGTSWSMLTHGIQVDAVEIEPEVPASASHFRELNHDVLDLPGFHLIINDARDHLRLTRERYDVISTDATNVQYKQNASLYSREYFELMKARLTPDGIACAWLPFAALPLRSVPHRDNRADDEFKILLRTFQAVFPHSYLFIFDQWNTDFAIVIGSPGPLRIELAELARRFQRTDVKRDLGEVDIVDPMQLLHFLYLDDAAMRRYDGPGWLHTDDLPVLERAASISAQVGYATLPERMRDLLALRPVSLEPLLSRPPAPAEREDLQRWRAFTHAWGDAIWAAMFAGLGTLPDRASALEKAEGALEKAWAGFGERPPLPRSRFLQLRLALQQLRRAPASGR